MWIAESDSSTGDVHPDFIVWTGANTLHRVVFCDDGCIRSFQFVNRGNILFPSLVFCSDYRRSFVALNTSAPRDSVDELLFGGSILGNAILDDGFEPNVEIQRKTRGVKQRYISPTLLHGLIPQFLLGKSHTHSLHMYMRICAIACFECITLLWRI